MLKRAMALDTDGIVKGAEFALGDKVWIDGGDIVTTVVGITIAPEGITYRVSWQTDGLFFNEVLSEGRLSAVAVRA